MLALVVVGGIATLTVVSRHFPKTLANIHLPSELPIQELSQVKLPKIALPAHPEQILSQIPKISGQVLGSSTEPAGELPIHQKAFEFARYSYCQEVVKDYKIRYPNSSQP